jgi:hypothetical protein
LWDTSKKDFFFEKKKQKTFATFALCVWQHRFSDFNRKKFFGSFFQKRTLLPSSQAPYLNASLGRGFSHVNDYYGRQRICFRYPIGRRRDDCASNMGPGAIA